MITHEPGFEPEEPFQIRSEDDLDARQDAGMYDTGAWLLCKLVGHKVERVAATITTSYKQCSRCGARI